MRVPRIEVGPEAQSSAGLSLAAAVIQLLITKGVMSRDEAVEMYRSLASTKHSKAQLHSSDIEQEAGDLLDHLANRLEEVSPTVFDRQTSAKPTK